MSIFNRLMNNKGTVSSALGKQLAQEALSGNKSIIKEAVELTTFDPKNKKAKNVRAGAAKIVEKVAEKKPELVSSYLNELKPALDVPEPQTRWMTIHTFGLCAKLNPEPAVSAVEKAKQYLDENAGVCLTSAAATYLGNIGELSSNEAQRVFPLLESAIETASLNEVDWILESFYKIFKNVDEKTKEKIVDCAKLYAKSSKKSQQKSAEKLLKIATCQ